MNANSILNDAPEQSMRMLYQTEPEQRLIVAVLIDGEPVVSEIREHLTHRDFFSENHQLIFRAIERLADKGEPVDLLTVSNSLRQEGRIKKISSYLAALYETVPTATSIPYCCQLVKQASQRRAMVKKSREISRMAQEHLDHDELLDEAQSAFANIDDISSSGDVTYEELSHSRLERLEGLQNNSGVSGVPTGLTMVDKLTGGFQKGDLVILSARPAMGKTALALTTASWAARNGHPVAMVSLEMDPGQLYDRNLANCARIDTQKFRGGKFTNDEWKRLTAAAADLSELPIRFEKKPQGTISQITRWIRNQHRKHGARLIIIDYLQLIRGNPIHQRKDLEIADITRSLKTLAVKLDVSILLLSQLNRNLEARSDKRPQLADLRDSGAIEQDADVVMFIYRDEYYNEKTSEPGIAEIKIAKHRNGPTGLVKVAWVAWRCAFEDLVP